MNFYKKSSGKNPEDFFSPYLTLADEATSALDEETEKKLLKNILEKAPEKTCIVTTHRPGVLRLCRRVYRVEDGKIAEQKQDFSGQSDCRTVRHRNFSG